jgi:hypothetical protein
MTHTRRHHFGFLAGALVAGGHVHAHAEEIDFGAYTDADKEKLLMMGRILTVEDIGHGVTKPVRAQLEFQLVKHSAQIQVVDKELSEFFAEDGTRVPMRDSFRFNVAAYKIDRLLRLNMATVAVVRRYKGKPAAFSWWVDNVMMEEVERVKKELKPPDSEAFERQRAVSRVFDELIINIDRNLSNLLITRDWRLALIDHSRSFNAYHGIRNKENLTRCSRKLMGTMKTLTEAAVATAVGKNLTPAEVKALVARRDRIVEFFEKRSKVLGEENVLFG